MYLMFQAIAKGSWKAPLIICGLILFGGLALQKSINNDIVEREQALRTAQPDPTSLDIFDRKKDIHPADEMHVTARLNTDYNYRLIEEKDGRTNQVRFMYVFFGPSQADTTKQARAAVIFDAEDKDTFANQLQSQTAEKLRVMINETGDKSFEPNIFTLAGLRDRRPDLKKIADQAFEEQGLVKGQDLIYIEPFLNGRTAGLRPDYEFLSTWKYVWGTLFAIFALITAFKFMGRQKWQAKRDTQQATKTYRAPQSTAQKASAAQAPWPPTAPPAPLENAAKTNRAENLVDWAQNHPFLAIATAFFILLVVLPGTAMRIAPFLFAGASCIYNSAWVKR